MIKGRFLLKSVFLLDRLGNPTETIYMKIFRNLRKSIENVVRIVYNTSKATKRSSRDELLLKREGGWCKPEKNHLERVLEL